MIELRKIDKIMEQLLAWKWHFVVSKSNLNTGKVNAPEGGRSWNWTDLIQDFSFVKVEYQLKKCDTYWPTRSDWIWNIFDRIKFKLWNTTGRSWNSRSINWRHRKYWVSIAQSQSLTHKPKNAESALTMYTGYKTGSKPETDIKFILFIPLSEQTCT